MPEGARLRSRRCDAAQREPRHLERDNGHLARRRRGCSRSSELRVRAAPFRAGVGKGGGLGQCSGMSVERISPRVSSGRLRRARNRSRFSASMMSAVSPLPDLAWCSSPACQRTASPGSMRSSTPSAPLTRSADPSSTARICGMVAGCRRSRPPGSNPEDRRLDERPSSKGEVRAQPSRDRVDPLGARTPPRRRS